MAGRHWAAGVQHTHEIPRITAPMIHNLWTEPVRAGGPAFAALALVALVPLVPVVRAALSWWA